MVAYSGKVKHELRVRSSDIRVASSNPRVRRLKARVARLKTRGGRLKEWLSFEVIRDYER